MNWVIIQLIPIALVAIVTLPAFYFAHYNLRRCYLWHARKFCQKNGLKLSKWRLGPAFNESGTKTEFTIVDLDCLDAQGQRKFIRLLVWAFGVRKVLIDLKFPESEADKWPEENSYYPRFS